MAESSTVVALLIGAVIGELFFRMTRSNKRGHQ